MILPQPLRRRTGICCSAVLDCSDERSRRYANVYATETEPDDYQTRRAPRWSAEWRKAMAFSGTLVRYVTTSYSVRGIARAPRAKNRRRHFSAFSADEHIQSDEIRFETSAFPARVAAR